MAGTTFDWRREVNYSANSKDIAQVLTDLFGPEGTSEDVELDSVDIKNLAMFMAGAGYYTDEIEDNTIVQFYPVGDYTKLLREHPRSVFFRASDSVIELVPPIGE